MTPIQNHAVENIAECDLLHDRINHPKMRKKKIHYSPILNGCINNIKGKANF